MACGTAKLIVLTTLLLTIAAAHRLAIAEKPSQTASHAVSHDWPGFLGPARNGKSAETGLPKQWPAQGLPIVWQAEVGTGYAAPAIAGGRLFHFARFDDRRNDDQGQRQSTSSTVKSPASPPGADEVEKVSVARLTALDAETGKTLWTCEYPTAFEDMLGYNNGPRATPMVDGDRVYTYGAEGVLQCVQVADGKVVWRIDTLTDFGVVKNFFGVGSTPLIHGDLLLVCVGGSPPGGPSDVYAANGRVEANGTAVVAFDKATGKIRWKTGDELASYASPVVAKIDGGDVVFMFARGGLLAIDPAKGEVRAHFPWRARKLESVNASTPVVVGNEIFISETYELGSALVRFNGKAFEEIWTDRNRRRNQAMALHWNTPIERDGYLYGSSGYHAPEAELRCVEWKTGKVMWSEPGMGRCSLLLVEDKLICLSEDGSLRILNATPQKYDELVKWEMMGADGKPLLPYPSWAAPALANGLLYVEGANRLVCLRLLEH